MTAEEQVSRAVNAYVQGGMPALEELTGPDPVEAPVFWEAVRRIGANRRALVMGRYKGGVDRWDRHIVEQEEAIGDASWQWKGGNV